MKKALLVVSLLTLVATAAATDFNVRMWLAPIDTPAGQVSWRAGYGFTTPYQVGSNSNGSYDIHRKYVSAPSPGSVTQSTAANTMYTGLTNIPTPNEPSYPQDTAVTLGIWMQMDGWAWPDGDPADPTNPHQNWTKNKIQGLGLEIEGPATLTFSTRWYQWNQGTTPKRWEAASDMSGNKAILAGVTTDGFTWGDPGDSATWTSDLLDYADYRDLGGEVWVQDGYMLLGAVTVTGGWGDLYIALTDNGISKANRYSDQLVKYGAGTEGYLVDAQAAPGALNRRGATPEARFIPEPAGLILLGLALVLRRR